MSADRYKIEDQEATYFLTLTIVNWIDLFTREDYRIILVDSLRFSIRNYGLVLNAWVIMSNHIHLVGRVESGKGMSGFLRDFKKFTSSQFSSTIIKIPESRKEWLLDKFSFEARKTMRTSKYKVWKDGNHAIDLSNTHIDAADKIYYIHMNPVKAGWVRIPEHYIYCSAIDYSGRKGLIDIEQI
jgi:REP-associated tyrosine transposase